jgi:hypothetical protein
MEGTMSRLEFSSWRTRAVGHLAMCSVLAVLAPVAAPLHAQDLDLDPIGRDTGEGIPVSMFGTYVEKGQLLVYPFVEYYRDSHSEYQPSELGYVGDADYFGSYEALEGLIFLGYGISDRWAVEFEAAVISARQERDPTDPGDFPQELKQSGLGDVEGQLRYMWRQQTVERGGIFSYFETVFPIQKEKQLIGTPTWEFKFGTGYIRSHTWGTMTYRASVAYAEGPEIGEYAVEYVRQLSNRVRVYGGVEGTEDEVELITDLQFFLASNVVLKVNNAFGLTKKAATWAPELGVLFRFR